LRALESGWPINSTGQKDLPGIGGRKVAEILPIALAQVLRGRDYDAAIVGATKDLELCSAASTKT